MGKLPSPTRKRLRLCLPTAGPASRPDMRSTRRSIGTSTWTAARTLPPAIVSRASACLAVRGYPSRIAPADPSDCPNRFSIISIVISSGTSSPLERYFCASSPIGVPSFKFSRKRSPLDTCGSSSAGLSRFAWVPFPAPGTPSKTIKINPPYLTSNAESYPRNFSPASIFR